jgi:hypothetical protein
MITATFNIQVPASISDTSIFSRTGIERYHVREQDGLKFLSFTTKGLIDMQRAMHVLAVRKIQWRDTMSVMRRITYTTPGPA